ncbi:recombination mediator RecR [Marinicella sp. W31]|uniref:recombination mediator RecR n=1 Tax=Marinicella sp. W31 TaxID=3023713 RepID=UPI0037565BC6
MSLVSQLIKSLQILPGVGAKSAQRMTFHLLQKNQQGAEAIAHTLLEALQKVKECPRCRTLTELELCRICASEKRNSQQICVVESAADIIHMEQATDYRGRYFVLHGKLSPIDGIGIKELKLDLLVEILAENPVEEMIIATGSTIEGETTAQYLSQLAESAGITASRLAHGVPLGGEIEYIDSNTLAHAFGSRVKI